MENGVFWRRARAVAAFGLAASALAGWLVAADGYGPTPAQASASKTVDDETGDAGQAGDVTRIVISNDDNGLITVRITFANRPAIGDEGVTVFLDGDKSTSTGCNGSEYKLRYFGSSFPKYAVDRCDGATFTENVSAPSFGGSFDGATQTMTLSVNRADLGGTLGFYSFVYTAASAGPGNDYVPSDAPAGNRIDYTIVLAPPPPPPDTTPPTTPGNLRASASSTTTVAVTWDASTDNVGVTAYQLFRNGAHVATPTATSYSDSGLKEGQTYRYEVRALDAAGNTSPLSAPATTTTPEPDSDGDSVVDSVDECDAVRGGTYDKDGDGCPGPFARLRFTRLYRAIAVSGSPLLTVKRLVLLQLAPGTVVTVSHRSFGRERLVARSEAVASRKLRNRKFRLRETVHVRAIKPGMIGYDLDLRLRDNEALRLRCMPAVGKQTPTLCKRINLGR
ncbi:MAG: fibronectin type III domain-containing protein [Gaiellaceae bacterium]